MKPTPTPSKKRLKVVVDNAPWPRGCHSQLEVAGLVLPRSPYNYSIALVSAGPQVSGCHAKVSYKPGFSQDTCRRDTQAYLQLCRQDQSGIDILKEDPDLGTAGTAYVNVHYLLRKHRREANTNTKHEEKHTNC